MNQSAAFLWAFRIEPDGIGTFQPEQALSDTRPESGYQWVHLQSDAKGADELLMRMGLGDAARSAILAMETRPRSLSIDDGLLVYLRGINKNPGAEPEDMVSLRVWIKGNQIVTARRRNRRLLSAQEVRSQVEQGQAPLTPVELLLSLISHLADKIHEAVDEMDGMLVEFETAESLEKSQRLELAALRRKSAAIRRYLAPQRDALDALFRMPELLNSDQAHFLREQSDRMTRYVEDLDLARERAIVLQDELRNRVADQQGMRMYVLSMVTAIFLPLSFLTGVFGMNVGGLPGTESQEAFTILMVSMIGLAAVLLVAMLWKRWL
ncbi:zinc transporter ZntB [Alteromonas aestuariivivens]|uniref:Zinc transporter ZntB n=1 Tax=Alteromonas aestuariivivens TaxID=1938339 RepID=A0A3D8M6V1_9ALTE|nr:zinc transporter ZntB [Alteromonas aestuariivivens]RDV25506.1 zinc transporter ZntB [Alteromonas aestuariivivens]